MPAFAQFATVTVGGSAFFKSLRSRLLGSSGKSAKSNSGYEVSGGPVKTPASFGSNQTPRRKNYYELTDSALLKSQGDTVLGDTSEGDREMQSKPSSVYPNSAYRETEQGV